MQIIYQKLIDKYLSILNRPHYFLQYFEDDNQLINNNQKQN